MLLSEAIEQIAAACYSDHGRVAGQATVLAAVRSDTRSDLSYYHSV